MIKDIDCTDEKLISCFRENYIAIRNHKGKDNKEDNNDYYKMMRRSLNHEKPSS